MLHQQISEISQLAGLISSSDVVEILFLMKFGTSGKVLLTEGVWFSPAMTYRGSSPVHLGRTSRALSVL